MHFSRILSLFLVWAFIGTAVLVKLVKLPEIVISYFRNIITKIGHHYFSRWGPPKLCWNHFQYIGKLVGVINSF